MPGVYREKTCPSCGKLHRKRGNYCGQSCASKQLVHSEETKQRISEKVTEISLSPDKIAHGHMLAAGNAMSPDEYAVNIPEIKDLSDYDLDNYDRADNW